MNIKTQKMKKMLLLLTCMFSLALCNARAQDRVHSNELKVAALTKKVSFVVQSQGYTIHIYGEIEYGSMGNATSMVLTMVIVCPDGQVSVPINYTGQFREPGNLRKHKYTVKEELNKEDSKTLDQIMQRLYLPKSGKAAEVQFEQFN